MQAKPGYYRIERGGCYHWYGLHKIFDCPPDLKKIQKMEYSFKMDFNSLCPDVSTGENKNRADCLHAVFLGENVARFCESFRSSSFSRNCHLQTSFFNFVSDRSALKCSNLLRKGS